MADIRINSLPTTASASSSDDFLALDGATNGTRKLNAFSPTFGGNLTVSGTGTHSFSGMVEATQLKATAGSSAQGSMWTNSPAGLILQGKTGSTNDFTITNPAANANVMVVPTGTTNAVFGTSPNTVTLAAGNLTVSGGTVTSGTGTLTLNSSANTVVLQSSGTTALTLDASQNATFAGNVTASKAGAAFYSIESTVNGALSEVIIKGKNSLGTAREARLGLNKYADDVFSIYDGTTERFRLNLTNGAATFAGSITLNTSVAFLSATSGKAIISYSSVGGLNFTGAGSVNDLTIYNKNGNVVLENPTGTTTAKFGGKINAASLPTSASGLSAGDIWNDGGTLKIV